MLNREQITERIIEIIERNLNDNYRDYFISLMGYSNSYLFAREIAERVEQDIENQDENRTTAKELIETYLSDAVMETEPFVVIETENEDLMYMIPGKIYGSKEQPKLFKFLHKFESKEGWKFGILYLHQENLKLDGIPESLRNKINESNKLNKANHHLIVNANWFKMQDVEIDDYQPSKSLINNLNRYEKRTINLNTPFIVNIDRVDR